MNVVQTETELLGFEDFCLYRIKQFHDFKKLQELIDHDRLKRNFTNLY